MAMTLAVEGTQSRLTFQFGPLNAIAVGINFNVFDAFLPALL